MKANRLKTMLADIMHPLQSAFVLRRLISDNTLVATDQARGISCQCNPLSPYIFIICADEKKKIHWRSWNRLCVPKREGGMGFKNLHWFDLAMLAK